MAHWTDAYIGLPYIAGEQDCAAVVARVAFAFDQALSCLPSVTCRTAACR